VRELTIATAVNMNWLIRQRATYCSPAKNGDEKTETSGPDNTKHGHSMPNKPGTAAGDNYCARSSGIKKCKNPDSDGKCPNDYSREDWKCQGKKSMK